MCSAEQLPKLDTLILTNNKIERFSVRSYVLHAAVCQISYLTVAATRFAQ